MCSLARILLLAVVRVLLGKLLPMRLPVQYPLINIQENEAESRGEVETKKEKKAEAGEPENEAHMIDIQRKRPNLHQTTNRKTDSETARQKHSYGR